MRKAIATALLSGILLLVSATAAVAAGSGGITGPALYEDGTLYRTVGTPTDLSGTGAPASSFDTLYNFLGAQEFNVIEASPGDPGFNGGRWLVHGITFADYDAALAAFDTNASGDFDSDEEVEAALQAGAATDLGVIRSFECPVNKVPSGA